MKVDTATFTYQERLRLSPDQDAALTAYADLFGRVERKLFAACAAGTRIDDLKTAYLRTFGLTARQFNAIAIGVKGKIAAIKERRAGLIKEAEERIARASDVIMRLEKRKPRSNDLHQKRRRLANLQAHLDRLQEDHAANRVRLCFGTRRLFQAQFDLAGNGYESHGEWLEDWQAARSDEIFVIGSKDETAGCQGCTASLQADGGARDSAVVALRIEAKNVATGHTERFDSAYTVDATYFGANDNVATRTKRPKMPFAPLAIAGRTAWSGTILFYPPEHRVQKLVEPKSKIEVTLRLVTPDAGGWLNCVLSDPPAPITLVLDVPDFLPGALLAGDLARLRATPGERDVKKR